MDIQVKHEVIKNSSDKIKFRRFKLGGYEHYNIRLFIEGEDLSEVSFVEYELHPTFPNPLRKATNSEQGFAIDIWTWGEFEINVSIHFKNREIQDVIHSVAYSNELPADEQNYIDVSPKSYRGVMA